MPFSWTLSGTLRRDEIREFGREALPRYVTAGGRPEEEIEAHAEMVALGLCMAEGWIRQLYIGDAEGEWLDELGFDRAVYRRGGEGDPSYRTRLGTAEDAVTPPAVLGAVADMLASAGATSSPVQAVELMCDSAFFGDHSVAGGVSVQSYFGDGSGSGATNGDRMTHQDGCPHAFVVLLPAGTSALLQATAFDVVRIKKAFGFAHFIEVQV